MPEMVVVSVLPEEEDVLHSVTWCSPLPCAVLQVLWIRRTCFIARLTCDHSLVGFPVALWQHQLKTCTEVPPQCLQPVVWDGCPVSPAGCHLCSACLTLLPGSPTCTGVALVWTLWHLFALFSVLQTCLFLPLPFGQTGSGWLCGSTCARADPAPLPAVQEELGRSPTRCTLLLTVGEIDEQASPQKCGAETDSLLCFRSNAFESVAVG